MRGVATATPRASASPVTRSNGSCHAMHREIERAVVNRHEPAAAQIDVRLHRFLGLHVDVGPLRIVGAGFDQRHVERAEPLADRR